MKVKSVHINKSRRDRLSFISTSIKQSRIAVLHTYIGLRTFLTYTLYRGCFAQSNSVATLEKALSGKARIFRVKLIHQALYLISLFFFLFRT